MTKKKLLRKLQGLLNPETYKKNKQRDELKKILKKLKKKELKVKDKVKSCSNKESKKLLEMELEIIHVQRKKGIAVLRGEHPVETPVTALDSESVEKIEDSEAATQEK